MALMRRMVADGEVDALVPERVWQELSRGLMEDHPAGMFEVLRECGALQRLLPEVAACGACRSAPSTTPRSTPACTCCWCCRPVRAPAAPLPVRWACLCHDLGKGTTPPELWPRHHGPRRPQRAAGTRAGRPPARAHRLPRAGRRDRARTWQRAPQRRPVGRAVLRLLERCDALRRPERFAACCWPANATCAAGRLRRPRPTPRPRLTAALQAVLQADTAP
jgi:tRNA nucleotidyltransferase (CCA-adding enzyme)